MNSLNLKLAIAAAVCLLLSVFSWHSSISRAQRFERGQKFLPNLNPDNIAEIEIRKGENQVRLKRQDDKFVVVSTHNYPAKNESVNRFLRNVLDISLEKKVGTGADLAKELNVAPGNEETTEITFHNASGKMMVHFFVGNQPEGGQGNFLRRADSEEDVIYLSSSGVYLSNTDDSFLDKQILDTPQAEIERIEGPDFKLVAEEGGPLTFQNLPANKKEHSTNLSQVKGMTQGLSYKSVFLADDHEVSNLQFDKTVTVFLKDSSGYQFDLAQNGERYFLKVNGFFDQEAYNASRAIRQDESEEELQKKSETLVRGDEIQKFNAFHGSWIYELTDFVAKKFIHKKADLMEDKEDKDAKKEEG